MLNIIILAGGLGKRFCGKSHKLLSEINKKKIIDFTLDNALKISNRIICVTSKYTDTYIKNYSKKLKCIKQVNPLGTGHAVSLAIKHIKDNDAVLIMYGDMPLIKKNSLEKLIYNYMLNKKPILTFFNSTADIDFGIIKTENNKVKEVIEKKFYTTQKKIKKKYNGGIFICEKLYLKKLINKININKKINEILLTDIFSIAYNEYYPFSLFKIARKEMHGVNSTYDLDKIKNLLKVSSFK